jgi:hypothetical protein
MKRSPPCFTTKEKGRALLLGPHRECGPDLKAVIYKRVKAFAMRAKDTPPTAKEKAALAPGPQGIAAPGFEQLLSVLRNKL